LTTLVLSGGERGLLGLAFAPDYATSGRFFVNYTRKPDGHTVVARYRRSDANPLRADPASRHDLQWPGGNTYIAQPFANHNAGDLAFGSDGYLYVPLGDGGSENDPDHRAQNPAVLLGKMLRINVDVPDGDVVGTSFPRTTHSSATRAFSPRSGRSASGIRSGSRSTRSRAGHGRDRDWRRRTECLGGSTTSRSASAAATTAGAIARALTRTSRRSRRAHAADGSDR
jgi:hypothetical protein